jgi:hypothetical protein
MNFQPGQDYIFTDVLTLTVASSDFNAIGGFHTLCADVGEIPGHPLSGYKAGDPLPASLWNLGHRAKCGNNAGMVYDAVSDRWVDIYLVSSPDRRILLETFEDYVKLAAEQGKRLPTHEEFSALAEGTNELTNISGSKYTSNTGGHVDTLGRSSRAAVGLMRRMPVRGAVVRITIAGIRFPLSGRASRRSRFIRGTGAQRQQTKNDSA